MTNILLGRVEAHRGGTGSSFTSRYRAHVLVYYEPFDDIEDAIQREKTLKQWVPAWKTNLIERGNPRWIDLYPSLLALPGNRLGRASGGIDPRDKREDDTGGSVPCLFLARRVGGQ